MPIEQEERERSHIGLKVAAALAEVSRDTLHRAAARGDIDYVTTPLGRLFRRADIIAWAAQRELQAGRTRTSA